MKPIPVDELLYRGVRRLHQSRMTMYASMMVIALSGLVGVADGEGAPAWQTDYFAAQKQGAEQKKPLAVFLAPGENGWDKLSREGGLDKDVNELLSGNYIPVFVNTESDAGR